MFRSAKLKYFFSDSFASKTQLFTNVPKTVTLDISTNFIFRIFEQSKK